MTRTWLNVENHLERFSVKWHKEVEARQIKIILDEVFSDFRKVLVPGKRTEPRYPCESLRSTL